MTEREFKNVDGKKVRMERECLICGVMMFNPRPQKKTCSAACRRELSRQKIGR
jgi:hypothetical protein